MILKWSITIFPILSFTNVHFITTFLLYILCYSRLFIPMYY